MCLSELQILHYKNYIFATKLTNYSSAQMLVNYMTTKSVSHMQDMKKEGLDFQLIAIPLGDVKGWGKYSRDVEVKKFLAPYQPINPYRLRKPLVD